MARIEILPELNVDDCLGQALDNKLEILNRVKIREMNGDFDYINNDLTNIKNIQDLIDICALKTPQNKGWIFEHFICNKMGWKHQPTWKHRGDGYSIEEKRCYEIKTSFNPKDILLKQVRLFQKIDRYLYVHFDELNIENSDVYILNHDEMVHEVKKCGKKNKHGTRKGNSYDIEIEYGSRDFRLWDIYYRNDFMKEKIFS